MSSFLVDNTVNKSSCTCLISGSAKGGRNYPLSLLEFIFWSLLERYASYDKIIIVGYSSSTKSLNPIIAKFTVEESIRLEVERKLVVFHAWSDFEAYLTILDSDTTATSHAIIISSSSELMLQEDIPLFINKAMQNVFRRFRETDNLRKLHLFATFYNSLHSKATFESVAALFRTVVSIKPANSGAGWTAAAEENCVAAEVQTVRCSHGRIHEKIELFRWGVPSTASPLSGSSFTASAAGTFLIPYILPSSTEAHQSKKTATSGRVIELDIPVPFVGKSNNSRLITFDKGDPEFDEDDDPDADLDL